MIVSMKEGLVRGGVLNFGGGEARFLGRVAKNVEGVFVNLESR